MTAQRNLSCVTGVRLLHKKLSDASWISEPCVLGIDEAGRGPVLGPMVYAAMFAPLAEDLRKRAFADSKTLNEAQRERLFSSIEQDERLGYCAEILSAAFLSQHMLGRERISLNLLALESTTRIIRAVLEAHVNVKEVYVDTVGDPDRYKMKLSQSFPSLEFTVCPKADALYPSVSGASIVAKVTRDHALLQCQQDLNIMGALGNGYPSDPDTKAWLRQNMSEVYGWPPIVRFSWETCTRMLAEQSWFMTYEADEVAEAGSDDGMTQSKLSFAGSRSSSCVTMEETTGVGRQSFFRVRKFERLPCVF